jgi:hypothetical protein
MTPGNADSWLGGAGLTPGNPKSTRAGHPRGIAPDSPELLGAVWLTRPNIPARGTTGGTP